MATYMRIGAVGASKSDVQIRGDVSEQEHDGWIELASFSFGSAPASDEDDSSDDEDDDGDSASADVAGSSDGSSRFRETGFSLSKWAGKDSPKILDWALSGKPYDLQVDCCNENGEPFMRFFLTEARITSFSQDSESGDDVMEEMSLLFDTIAFESTGFTKEETRKTPSRVSTKSSRDNVAIRTGGGLAAAAAAAGVGVGKGVSKRVAVTSAAGAAARVAAKVRSGDENPDFIQEDRCLEIDPVGGVKFELGQLVGSEEMSGLFHFSLEVTTDNLDVRAADVIGKPVGFRIHDHDEIDPDRTSPTREFHGVISEVLAGQGASDHRDYTLVVVPWLWFLTKKTDCRIFQKKNVLEIVEDVFSEMGFKDFDKSNVRGTYEKLEYCVQYRESDFAFVSRLLEENGIFYFFRFAKGSHTMVLADASVAHANGAQKNVIQSTGSIDGKRIHGWMRRLSQVSGAMSFRDYNHTTPTESLQSKAVSKVDLPKISKYEVYDYPGRYGTVQVGGKRAQWSIEAEEVSHCVVEGDGNVDAFACGTKFTIDEHESASEKGEYVLTGVVHQAYVLPMSDIKARVYYENEFECIPKKVTFRPACLTERPLIAGPQTAVVVGKAGEEIDPDLYGGVKVQFHWDRLGKKDENSSCFVRVAQSVAGKKWGGLWLPRVGQEVVVEFLEGNPDRPLITGAVYNEQNQPPYPLPANKTQSVMKTRSVKQGKPENFNELSFEDKLGSEKIYVHAEKDFHRVVENNEEVEVGIGDGKGDRKTTIAHDDVLTVGKDGDGSQSVSIAKNRSVTVEQGDDTLDVKKGKRAVTVDVGDDTHTVKQGSRVVSVDKGDDKHTVKAGDRTVEVAMGNDALTIKMGDQKTKVNLGKSSTTAMNGIELKVGSNSIKIDQMGVTIKGMNVKVDGQIQTEIKGLMCKLNGSAMLKAGGGIMMLG